MNTYNKLSDALLNFRNKNNEEIPLAVFKVNNLYKLSTTYVKNGKCIISNDLFYAHYFKTISI